VRTLIISDLHLGSAARVDLLRRPELREVLFENLRDIDRLVLLGDVLELRHGPRREALAVARPFFEDLGRVFAEREVVLTAGNHDHALVEPWLQRRGEQQTPPGPLGTEQRLDAASVSPMLATLADWASPARLIVAYPGLWVRPDVYATHGHYLDAHLTVPTMERLGIAAMGRMTGRHAADFDRAEDYEAVGAPVFAWLDAIAAQKHAGDASGGLTTVRAWQALRGIEGERTGRQLIRTLRTRAAVGGFSLAVSGLNRAGLGPLRADISAAELRRAALRAMGEVAARLGLGEAHVIFGHTHRKGPSPQDVQPEWMSPAGGSLLNAGCWTYASYFLTPALGESPYWPGGTVLVEDQGAPLLRCLLADRSHNELAPS
jgi:Calcineurin-like phosphoesterase